MDAIRRSPNERLLWRLRDQDSIRTPRERRLCLTVWHVVILESGERKKERNQLAIKCCTLWRWQKTFGVATREREGGEGNETLMTIHKRFAGLWSSWVEVVPSGLRVCQLGSPQPFPDITELPSRPRGATQDATLSHICRTKGATLGQNTQNHQSVNTWNWQALIPFPPHVAARHIARFSLGTTAHFSAFHSGCVFFSAGSSTQGFLFAQMCVCVSNLWPIGGKLVDSEKCWNSTAMPLFVCVTPETQLQKYSRN